MERFYQQRGELPDYLNKRARKDPDGRLWVDQNLGKLTQKTIQEMKKEGRVFETKKGGLRRKQYLDEMKGSQINDVWDIPILNSQSKERVGYPTQKPLALLERIIKASSRRGAVVLDPFCGCATTCVAADREQRNWIGIDISPKAAELVVERIKTDQGLFEDIKHRTDIPKRTDLGDIPRYNAPENKTLLYGTQAGHCNGCGGHFRVQNLEVDHIIAESVGGTDHIDNLQLLCGNCNRVKGDRGQDYLIKRLSERAFSVYQPPVRE